MKIRPQVLPELFASVIEGNGLLGDVLITPDLEALIGKQVTGWQVGWEDSEVAERDKDKAFYLERGYESVELAGILTRVELPRPNGEEDVAWEVGGRPADPATIHAAKRPRKKAKASGKPTAPASTRTAKRPKGKANAGGMSADAKTIRPTKPPKKKTN